MLHYILVKWKEGRLDKATLSDRAAALLTQAVILPGVEGVMVQQACMFGERRGDLMVCMKLERNALPAFDASNIHRKWKEVFGPYIQQKMVFDWEGL